MGRSGELDNGVDIAVPDQLLMPLIEVAADVLRELESHDVPSSLRQLHGFDRRGLLAGPAPKQLRRAMVTDELFRKKVVEKFLARPEVGGTLLAWTVEIAAATAGDAVARGDLALYTSALWAARPDGCEFGLGIAVVLDAQFREQRRESEAGKSWAQEREALEEACRRAETARIEADAAAANAEQELQKERTTRRAREGEALAAASAAQRQVNALQTQLDQTRAEVEEQENRATRAAQRSRSLEADLRRVRGETRELQVRTEAAESRLSQRDDRALADAATAARQLSVSLDAIQRRIRDGVPAEDVPVVRDAPRPDVPKPVRPPAPTRRTAPQIPPGVLIDSPAGVEAMLSTPDVVLVVDGYNVANRAWANATAADQRERLGMAANTLCHRHKCEIVLVFDGDGSGRPALRRGGLRVVFSEAGEEADEVVVREVENRPRRIPVVVASSDAWVRQHAGDEGASVVSADALVRVICPSR